jgi:uncharacterized protein (DUF433 family)
MNGDWTERVVEDSSSPGGARLRATDLPVGPILDALANGWSHERLLGEYPALAQEDILACLAFAAEAVRKLVVVRKIREGIADIDAGRFIPHEEILSRLGVAEEDTEE